MQALGDEQPWIILRPPIVYGPRDDATRLLFRQALAPLSIVPWTRRPLSLMHVEDVARALHLAGESILSRRVLPLDGPNRLDTDSLIREIGRACRVDPRLFRVPLMFVRALVPLCDLWARLRRRPGFLCTDKLRDVAARGWVADPVPAEEQLGFVPAWTTANGFRDTAVADGFVDQDAGD